MRGIQYAAASRLIMTISGILDRPPEPVIRPAKGRTGWRAMTTEVCCASSQVLLAMTMWRDRALPDRNVTTRRANHAHAQKPVQSPAQKIFRFFRNPNQS